jgi:hypothetical protein
MARALICPKGFSDDEADVWYAAQRQMRHQGTWSGKSDIPLLESYVRNVVLARQARQAINAYGDPFRAAGEIDRALIRGHLKVATDAEGRGAQVRDRAAVDSREPEAAWHPRERWRHRE